MDHMIYIYAGLAFVLAGGGWFIGWHGGYRRGYRDKKSEYERMHRKIELNAQFGKGLVYDVNSLYPVQFRQFDGEPYPDRSGDLSEAIHTHLEIMDADD